MPAGYRVVAEGDQAGASGPLAYPGCRAGQRPWCFWLVLTVALAAGDCAWRRCHPDLVEPWHNLVVTARGWPGGPPTNPAGWAADPAGLEGADNDLADVLARVPTGRLVVLGEPGAGKTMLLIRLLLDLLARRAPPARSWPPAGT